MKEDLAVAVSAHQVLASLSSSSAARHAAVPNAEGDVASAHHPAVLISLSSSSAARRAQCGPTKEDIAFAHHPAVLMSLSSSSPKQNCYALFYPEYVLLKYAIHNKFGCFFFLSH